MQESEAIMNINQGIGLATDELPSAQMMRVLSSRLPYLHRCAYKLLGNKADAEDAVQDAVLAAYTHLNEFRGKAQISTWLMAILINCARMQLRKRSRRIHVSLDSPIGEGQKFSFSEFLVDQRPNPEDVCHKSILSAQLIKSAARLSPTLRKAFHLRYVDQLSLCEMARVLGLPIGTVKARTARARAKLLKLTGVLKPQSRSCGRCR